ncbi:restriction endonuclease FokI C-terminal domain-containing protein [Paludisphaera mucosa]|uniref:FokI cleavage domain-containing protein n=1 Tax=Paludisphaera mucosa TaxID=3030827 RepID=A0ABT6FL60_9BACT|nr:hypothetical protein [Paludisphaera mucosa]MDG3008311.1 hypothetical protein [Paludisphaera mucosa]
MLTPEQSNRAVEVMREYLSAPRNPDGRTPLETQGGRDLKRARLIDAELKPLVASYLTGGTPLAEFKSKIDGINKRNEFWGFKGIKGQMFFNMVVNVADDEAECDQELKAAIALPTGEEIARSRIKTFHSYVKRIGHEFVESGGTKQGRPNPGSIPFFLSYFWQVQDRATWPVFYTNSVNTMVDLNLWQPSDELAEDYLAYKHIQEELAALFTQASGRPFDLYGVEHVFWFKGGNPYGDSKPLRDGERPTPTPPIPPTVQDAAASSRLPESYVPPVVAILTSMARNEPGLEAVAKASGTSLPRAFEKSIHAAFTVLGFDTKLLGQGSGRVPDGLALEHDNSYAILWDAKVREDGYSMGTDDRAIREYVMTQSRELKRKKTLRNIYYAVVSSGFKDDYDDLIRSIKMETDTNEVCLLEAAALVAMVDARLRNPLQVSLGSDGLQRLFSISGILTADDVLKNFG